jgi:hypothetical protein
MQLNVKEKQLLKRNTAITLERIKPNFSNMHGCLLDISDKWILIQNISEFHLDGYSIIRKTDINKIRYDERDKYFEEILKKEGVDNKVSKKYKINLTNLSTIFESLKKIKLNIIVECENKKDDIFAIGKITQINKDSIAMHHFDACGKWAKKSKVIYYSKITTIGFDQEYINIFSRHLAK